MAHLYPSLRSLRRHACNSDVSAGDERDKTSQVPRMHAIPTAPIKVAKSCMLREYFRVKRESVLVTMSMRSPVMKLVTSRSVAGLLHTQLPPTRRLTAVHEQKARLNPRAEHRAQVQHPVAPPHGAEDDRLVGYFDTHVIVEHGHAQHALHRLRRNAVHRLLVVRVDAVA
eukprot:6201010-Pleurochrysis_carterae.AAC.3